MAKKTKPPAAVVIGALDFSTPVPGEDGVPPGEMISLPAPYEGYRYAMVPEGIRRDKSTGKLFVYRDNGFFKIPAPLDCIGDLAIEVEDDARAKVICNRIPWEDWIQICAFHRWSVATFRAETMISHLLTREGKFIHVPFHQQVTRGAMTIHVNYESPENEELYTRLIQEHGVNMGAFHGTTHNHVVSTAFESGVDKSDETDKQGFHFTLGQLDKFPLDIHARVRIIIPGSFANGQLVVGASRQYGVIEDYSQLIEVPGVEDDMPPELRIAISKHRVTRTTDLGFPEEWKAMVTEKKYVAPVTRPYTASTGTNYGGKNGFGHSPSSVKGQSSVASHRQFNGGDPVDRGRSLEDYKDTANLTPTENKVFDAFQCIFEHTESCEMSSARALALFRDFHKSGLGENLPKDYFNNRTTSECAAIVDFNALVNATAKSESFGFDRSLEWAIEFLETQKGFQTELSLCCGSNGTYFRNFIGSKYMQAMKRKEEEEAAKLAAVTP